MIRYLRKVVIRSAIFLHLSIVIITVSHLHEKVYSNIFPALNNLYSAYTNTNRCFGFFAPEVYNDLSVNMTAHSDSTSKKYLFKNVNFETRVRLYSLMGHFGENYDTVQMSLFSRSWALKIFTEDPKVKSVDVKVDWNVIPTMPQYLKGQRIQHSLFYSTHFDAN
jgi:hypothetical protein